MQVAVKTVFAGHDMSFPIKTQSCGKFFESFHGLMQDLDSDCLWKQHCLKGLSSVTAVSQSGVHAGSRKSTIACNITELQL